jgi:phosphatidylglycerophosphate synthase
MSGYAPVSRRPIAGMFRATAHALVNVAVRAGIHPDVFSYASILAAGAAGVLFWQSMNHPKYLILGTALALFRLWLNMFDGMVAVASGKASKKGEIINDLPDRVSDVIIFVGMAHSHWCHRLPGYWAAIMALLVAYVGLSGQAVGVQREFSGVMSKPWRIVVLGIFAVATSIQVHRDGQYWFGGWLFLDWANFIIVLGCVQTILIRLFRIFRALDAQAGPKA